MGAENGVTGMVEKKQIFISYARKDGFAPSQILRQRLIDESIEVWQDLVAMNIGENWHPQIFKAIEEAKAVVMVLTPEALKSPMVRQEWVHARQKGVCVYPVQVPDLPIDFATLPKWMRDSHFYNLDNEWETFVSYLKSPCQALQVPFTAPELSKTYVQRPEVFDNLKNRLLDNDRANPVATVVALQGGGGFGKTTLAIALCHDDDIQSAFDDGILWATLGERPDVLGSLTKLYNALSKERAVFVDIEDGKRQLADKLKDRDCLIVLDDVRNAAHLRPFLEGGERCARLITTRDVTIAVGAKAQKTEVDETSPDGALLLLTGEIEGLLDKRLHNVADRLGNWALMLELVNVPCYKPRMPLSRD